MLKHVTPDGKGSEAEAFIARYSRHEAPGVMPAKILEFLRGKLSETELLSAAGDDKIKMTDARSIIGAKRLIDGRTEAAIEHFKWVKKNGVRSPAGYALAMVELDRLTKK